MQINGFFKFEKFSLFLSILSWGKPGSPALQADCSPFEPPWNLKSHCIYIGELIGVPHWRRLLRVPWTAKEIQPVHPKGVQSWVFIGRTDAEAETPKLWPPHAKS